MTTSSTSQTTAAERIAAAEPWPGAWNSREAVESLQSSMEELRQECRRLEEVLDNSKNFPALMDMPIFGGRRYSEILASQVASMKHRLEKDAQRLADLREVYGL